MTVVFHPEGEVEFLAEPKGQTLSRDVVENPKSRFDASARAKLADAPSSFMTYLTFGQGAIWRDIHVALSVPAKSAFLNEAGPLLL